MVLSLVKVMLKKLQFMGFSFNMFKNYCTFIANYIQSICSFPSIRTITLPLGCCAADREMFISLCKFGRHIYIGWVISDWSPCASFMEDRGSCSYAVTHGINLMVTGARSNGCNGPCYQNQSAEIARGSSQSGESVKHSQVVNRVHK